MTLLVLFWDRVPALNFRGRAGLAGNYKDCCGKIRQQMKFGEWLMQVTLSLLWGGSFFLNGVAVAELPALTIVLGRVGFAAMALFIFMKWAGLAIPMDRQIWRLSLDGVFEQCYALLPDRLGAGLCYLWLRFDYQRNNTPLCGSCGAFRH